MSIFCHILDIKRLQVFPVPGVSFCTVSTNTFSNDLPFINEFVSERQVIQKHIVLTHRTYKSHHSSSPQGPSRRRHSSQTSIGVHLQLILLPPSFLHMRYDRSALYGCIWWLHQRSEHVGNGFHGQSLQRLHNKVKKLSSNRSF